MVNVDKIPSPDTTLMNLMPIVEETQQPKPEGTNIDITTEVQEPPNQEAKTLKEVQPENTEASSKVNETTTNLEAAVKPDESQTTISCHPPEGTVEYVMGWTKWYSKEQSEVAGTLSQPPQSKQDKI